MSRAQRCSTFIFDFFGVIASFDNDIVYARLAKHCRNPAEAFHKLNGLMADRDVITGRLTLPQIHENLVEAHGLNLGYEGFERAWLEPYSAPMPGMAEFVCALKSHYRLLLLLNVDRYYWDAIQTLHPELECFDAILLSCDLTIAKPDREIFLHASQVAGTTPSQCFFVDDSLPNVEGARALGFEAHLFKGLPGLLDELRQRNTLGV